MKLALYFLGATQVLSRPLEARLQARQAKAKQGKPRLLPARTSHGAGPRESILSTAARPRPRQLNSSNCPRPVRPPAALWARPTCGWKSAPAKKRTSPSRVPLPRAADGTAHPAADLGPAPSEQEVYDEEERQIEEDEKPQVQPVGLS